LTQEVIQKIHAHEHLSQCDIFIGSSHTHSGGGAYFDMPIIGSILAGPYDPSIKDFYVNSVVEAIVKASESLQPASIGIGYGNNEEIARYRAQWPLDISPISEVAVIKATALDGTPLAVLFNFPLHPTVLNAKNELFSADFVGYARQEIKKNLGDQVEAVFFNGAQGDIAPNISYEVEPFLECQRIGESLGKSVLAIWNSTPVKEELTVEILTDKYSFVPQPTPFGLVLPINEYPSELNAIILNQAHAFITIPGELSCVYDHKLKQKAKSLGYPHVSIFGLVNDAHGYILSPESWMHKTNESKLSFGGQYYGDFIFEKVIDLLYAN
jgi:hypothetical protein